MGGNALRDIGTKIKNKIKNPNRSSKWRYLKLVNVDLKPQFWDTASDHSPNFGHSIRSQAPISIVVGIKTGTALRNA